MYESTDGGFNQSVLRIPGKNYIFWPQPEPREKLRHLQGFL